MSQIKKNLLYLPNFTWQIDIRPISKEDIFRQPQRLTQAEIDKHKKELKAQEQEEKKNKRKKQNLEEKK
jgi:hypothetical protein